MPKLEPKQVQRELEQGRIWPVYWLYGSERMKSRELLKRVRKAALGEETAGTGLLGMAETVLEGAETEGAAVVEAALSPSLGGGLRLIVVRDAHAMKSPDEIASLLGPAGTRESLPSVCVFVSKDLDRRRKISKLLEEKAAVVSCEEVPEGEREAWIAYLSKRKGLELPQPSVAQLATLDPWSLDIIDQELEKFALNPELDVLMAGGLVGGADAFIDEFLGRDSKAALVRAASFADQPEEALPLLGLLAWNVRQLALQLAAGPGGGSRVNPYLAERLARWTRKWKLEDVLRLQTELERLDYGFKQTPLLPLGLWTRLVTEFA